MGGGRSVEQNGFLPPSEQGGGGGTQKGGCSVPRNGSKIAHPRRKNESGPKGRRSVFRRRWCVLGHGDGCGRREKVRGLILCTLGGPPMSKNGGSERFWVLYISPWLWSAERGWETRGRGSVGGSFHGTKWFPTPRGTGGRGYQKGGLFRSDGLPSVHC